MIFDLPKSQTPTWLLESTSLSDLPVQCLLSNSVYYPACGQDGKPVRFLGGFSHSFVYADYAVKRNCIVDKLMELGAFRGYQAVFGKDIGLENLQGPFEFDPIEIDLRSDGDPKKYERERTKPFAYWAVFERLPDKTVEHGPDRFSLLYLGTEGVDTYQWLYASNGLYPSAVAIIQPGEGFGFNWTHFYDSDRPLARAIRANKFGRPSYLILGGYGLGRRWQEDIKWPDYPELLHFLKTSDGYLGLWAKAK